MALLKVLDRVHCIHSLISNRQHKEYRAEADDANRKTHLVRVSSQTIALKQGLPVLRRQTKVVSR